MQAHKLQAPLHDYLTAVPAGHADVSFLLARMSEAAGPHMLSCSRTAWLTRNTKIVPETGM